MNKSVHLPHFNQKADMNYSKSIDSWMVKFLLTFKTVNFNMCIFYLVLNFFKTNFPIVKVGRFWGGLSGRFFKLNPFSMKNFTSKGLRSPLEALHSYGVRLQMLEGPFKGLKKHLKIQPKIKLRCIEFTISINLQRLITIIQSLFLHYKRKT